VRPFAHAHDRANAIETASLFVLVAINVQAAIPEVSASGHTATNLATVLFTGLVGVGMAAKAASCMSLEPKLMHFFETAAS